MGRPLHSPETLRKLLDYDPETGVLTRRTSFSNGIKAGDPTGSLNKLGYVTVCIDRHHYYAHRVAWCLAYGAWPDGEIDHANGCPSDNRLSNLRLANRSTQMANRRRVAWAAIPFKGVCFHPKLRRKQWQARIVKDGRRHSLGYFLTAEEAHAAYVAGAKRFFGEFARTE